MRLPTLQGRVEQQPAAAASTRTNSRHLAPGGAGEGPCTRGAHQPNRHRSRQHEGRPPRSRSGPGLPWPAAKAAGLARWTVRKGARGQDMQGMTSRHRIVGPGHPKTACSRARNSWLCAATEAHLRLHHSRLRRTALPPPRGLRSPHDHAGQRSRGPPAPALAADRPCPGRRGRLHDSDGLHRSPHLSSEVPELYRTDGDGRDRGAVGPLALDRRAALPARVAGSTSPPRSENTVIRISCCSL